MFLNEDDADRYRKLLATFEKVSQQLDAMEVRLVAAAKARGLV